MMNYYKDTANQPHSLDSKDFEYLLPNGCTEITQAEYEALSKPVKPTIEEQRAAMSCAAWQCKRALTAMGLRDAVESAIAAADYDMRDMWQATTFRRLNPRIIAMATELGKTAEEIDALFDLALTFNE